MTRPPLPARRRALAALLATSLALLAADRPGASPAGGAGPWSRDGASVRGSVAGLEMCFEPGAARFAAAPEGSLPALPVVFRLESAARGEALLAAAPGARPELDGPRVTFDHGSFLERYTPRAAGVEQSFVFPERPPGEGPLVVRGRLETALTIPPSGDWSEGVTFELGGAAAVRFGGVTGVDALGRTTPGSMRLDGDVLELELPERFVDEAAYPLVLDPLVGTSFEVTPDSPSVTDDLTPDAAYDVSWGVYLVVWAVEGPDVFGGTDFTVMGRRVSSGGTPLGSAFQISTPQDITPQVRVASCNLPNRFLVIWRVDGFLGNTVYAAAVDADDGAVSGAVPVSSSGGYSKSGLCAGSESTSLDDEVFVVWHEYDTLLGGNKGLHGRTVHVPSTGDPSVFDSFVVTLDPEAENPGLSRGGGAAGRFLVTFETPPDLLSPDWQLFGRLFDRNGNALTGITLLEPQDFRNEHELAIDGDGTRFVLAYESSDVVGGDPSIHAMVVRYSAPFGTLEVEDDWVVADPSGSAAREPDVAWMGGGLVSFTWSQVTGGGDAVYYAVHDLATGVACEPAAVVAASSDAERRPRFAGDYAGGLVGGGRALLVWESVETVFAPFDGDVRAQLLDPQDPAGTSASLGGGCGSGGTAQIVCAAGPGSATFTHVLQGAAPAASAFLVVAFDEIGAGCGPCTLVPDPFTGFVFAGGVVDVDGRAELTTPLVDSPTLSGLTFVEQWAVLPGAGACAALGADLSNALQVTLQ